jgi:hypothetical protein
LARRRAGGLLRRGERSHVLCFSHITFRLMSISRSNPVRRFVRSRQRFVRVSQTGGSRTISGRATCRCFALLRGDQHDELRDTGAVADDIDVRLALLPHGAAIHPQWLDNSFIWSGEKPRIFPRTERAVAPAGFPVRRDP